MNPCYNYVSASFKDIREEAWDKFILSNLIEPSVQIIKGKNQVHLPFCM